MVTLLFIANRLELYLGWRYLKSPDASQYQQEQFPLELFNNESLYYSMAIIEKGIGSLFNRLITAHP